MSLLNNTIINFVSFCYSVPAPSFVTITSEPISPIRPIGSTAAVICSVELSPSVDVPVNVSVQISDPSGSLLVISDSSVSESTHTSKAMVSSFDRNQSGLYTCEATLISVSPFLTESGTLSKDIYITTSKSAIGHIARLSMSFEDYHYHD